MGNQVIKHNAYKPTVVDDYCLPLSVWWCSCLIDDRIFQDLTVMLKRIRIVFVLVINNDKSCNYATIKPFMDTH
jgi:hypothetical protein